MFSAVGFASKRVPFKLISNKIFLSQKVYQIPEATIQNKKDKYIKIGKLKRQFPDHYFGANLGYSKMEAQLIAYEKRFEQIPSVKSIEFLTHSNVKNAKFNIRLYQLNSKSEPDKLIHTKNITAIARRGFRKTMVDLDSLKIRFPTSGLVVAIEWLEIEENKFEYTYTMKGSKKKLKATSIEPSFSVYKDIKDLTKWTYWGYWNKYIRQSKPIQMEIILKN